VRANENDAVVRLQERGRGGDFDGHIRSFTILATALYKLQIVSVRSSLAAALIIRRLILLAPGTHTQQGNHRNSYGNRLENSVSFH
jgi:hypothetical protein